MKEEISKYWCNKCKSKVNDPKWKSISNSIISAHCPRCDEEVARKINISYGKLKEYSKVKL